MPDLTPFWISIRVAVISMIIAMVLGTLISKWLCRCKGSWVKLLESLLILPTASSPTVLGLILLIIFSPRGSIGQFFANVLHLPVVFTLTGAVIASVTVSFPLIYQHIVQGFRDIDTEMINAARTMGASETKILLKLILPLAKRSILAGIMMSFARVLGEFGVISVVVGYIPNKTNTLSLEIYFLAEQGRENEAWLWVLVLVAFSIVVISTTNLLNRDRYKEVGQMLKTNVKYQLKNTLIRIDIDDTEPKIYTVRGPSGIGKVTILSMIAGLREADEAVIEVNGRLFTDTTENVNVKIQQRRIEYLFQDYQLFPNMTVCKNITFMAEPSEHIDQLIQTLNIDYLTEQYPMTLSGGEAQRVALARALSTKPDLVLLDEPFSSLDDTTKDESITLVKRILSEWQIPIILMTHSNYEVEQMAHEITTIR